MVTLGYRFWHSEEGCLVGPMGAARPMNRALEPAGPRHDIKFVCYISMGLSTHGHLEISILA